MFVYIASTILALSSLNVIYILLILGVSIKLRLKSSLVQYIAILYRGLMLIKAIPFWSLTPGTLSSVCWHAQWLKYSYFVVWQGESFCTFDMINL